MRPRDFGRIASAPSDLLIVGGGIYALAIALEAAKRGLRATLVEASDFGGDSPGGQQIAYGWLPALGTGRIARAREAVRERRALARVAPWLLRPLPVIVGTYRSATRGRLALRGAFKLDGWIGRHRNTGVEPELHLPAARLVSKAATLRLFPGVRPDGLTGGAQWYEYQIVENDRLTMAFAAGADQAGANIANHVAAVSAIRDGGRIAGMRVRDVLTGDEADLRAGVVVNATGATTVDVMRALGVTHPVGFIRTLTLVTSKRASDIALAAHAADGRILTLIPWKGKALVGTAQDPATGRDTSRPAGDDVDAFIAEARQVFPALNLQRSDVTLVLRGVTPVADNGDGAGGAIPRMIDHSDHSEGAVTVLPGHDIAARATARQVVAWAGRKLGRRPAASRAEPAVLPGAGIADHEALTIETARAHRLDLPLPLVKHLISRYAEHAARIVRLIAEDPRLGAPLDAGHPAIAAEAVFAIRHEMAVRLSDVVIRRLGLGATERPADALVRAAASIAASELGWDAAKVREEIAEVNRVYDLAK